MEVMTWAMLMSRLTTVATAKIGVASSRAVIRVSRANCTTTSGVMGNLDWIQGSELESQADSPENRESLLGPNDQALKSSVKLLHRCHFLLLSPNFHLLHQ